jgi:hypothetical protein
MACERRWIVLSEDGRHVSVGRDTDPDEAELATLADALRAQNTGGWLAMMEGNCYSDCAAPALMMVRPLAPAATAWEDAAATFQQRRRQTLNAA